ncbi:hypothetical protein TRAPUB_11852 [Trametes pubescens]|uniref:Uncharacterized protein n=1 Tax=Trametes pubescens TaxID=154538 RepID=A0A1M2VVI4_TRAPU|nr:hypothetical protein TRAPUB_11852 [Trametes pubescens]
MAPLRRWLGRVQACGPAAHINQCGDAGVPFDVPSYLLPLDLRVKLHEARAAPYHKPSNISATDKDAHPSTSSRPRKRKRTMPSLLNRLTGATSYPIVLAQYKNEFRGVGHESALHWVLVVITDKATLSGPSFQAYAQTTRAPRPGRRKPRLSDSSVATASSTRSRRSTSAVVTMGTLALDGPAVTGAKDAEQETQEVDAETDVQWYTRHGKASLFDVCATVRTLCLGGVQVGSVKAADLDKLCEYLRSHPPVPSSATPGWCSRDYVLELLELLRPYKLLRSDLQGKKPQATGAHVEVRMDDLLPELREVGRATQESIDKEDYRPFVKYHSA